MNLHTLYGKVYRGSEGEGEATYISTGIEEEDICLAEWAEQFSKRFITIRYWTSTELESPEAMKRGAVEEMLGKVSKTGIYHAYSELTGYLWTDEDFIVGGHDVIERVSDAAYLLLEVEVKE